VSCGVVQRLPRGVQVCPEKVAPCGASKLSSAGHRQAGGSCQEGGRAGQPPKLPTRREPSLSASPLSIYIWLHVYLYVFIDTASPFTASFPKLRESSHSSSSLPL
uniref:Uncharacterized protein n=1 Tax=Anas platyrhynchos TaxID=8839 RepID=A0A8B9TDH2_ANAPL